VDKYLDMGHGTHDGPSGGACTCTYSMLVATGAMTIELTVANTTSEAACVVNQITLPDVMATAGISRATSIRACSTDINSDNRAARY
jgi:LytS/YehU family sensor histidine kinase